MDPRHPEQAVTRLKELIAQYDRIERDIKRTTVSTKLGQLEREGGLVVQEICLVAPRLHEAMMQTSRQRRHQLSMGITYVPEEKVGNYIKSTIGMKQTSASGGLDEKEEAEWKTTEEEPEISMKNVETSVESPVLTDFEKNVKTGEETYVEPNQAETVIVEPKPRKKKTSKKKAEK